MTSTTTSSSNSISRKINFSNMIFYDKKNVYIYMMILWSILFVFFFIFLQKSYDEMTIF